MFLTDNPVLVRKHRVLPALMCAQNSASKIIPTDEDLMNSNISGFGSDIGKITNHITSMYEVQSRFSPDSDEYQILDYRIRSGQLNQQDEIDKIKGIISKPMPKSWYDPHFLKDIENDSQRELYERVIAHRKPYFMKYIYPALSKDLAKYERRYNRNAMRKFDIPIIDLLKTDRDKLSDEQARLVDKFYEDSPVGTYPSVMNQICHSFEDAFDSADSRRQAVKFDTDLLKSDATYTELEFKKINKIYKEYVASVQKYSVHLNYEREDTYDSKAKMEQFRNEFLEECVKICPNRKSLCNLVVDMLYTSSNSKLFAWEMCGDVMIENLMDKFGHHISFPVQDDNGDIYYGGRTYSVCTIDLEETEDLDDNFIE